MNRRDRLRLDERRRDSHQNNDRATSTSSNQTGNQKNLMNSYFESQQIIQRLSARPGASEAGATKTPEIPKSFRIPRKTSQPEERVERRDDRSRSRNESSRQRDNFFTGRGTSDSRWPAVEVPQKKKPNEPPQYRRGNNHRENERLNAERETESETPEAFKARRGQRTRGSQKGILGKKRSKDKPIQMFVFDHADRDGNIDVENVPALVEALVKIVKEELPTAKSNLKFLGHNYEDGVFLVMCANLFSSEFLRKNILQMQPLWSGAQLDCIYESYDECVVNVIVPNPICHLSEFLELCKKQNSALGTEKWRRIACEERSDGTGKLYAIGMDMVSYELIQSANGVIRCGDTDVKVELCSNK